MRYRVRTFLVFALVALPIIAALIWAIIAHSFPQIRDRPRNAAARKATEDFRKLLLSATELEIVKAGDAFTLRAKSFQSDSLKRLADAVVITEVEVTNVPSSVIENAYIQFRLRGGDHTPQEWFFSAPESLVDESADTNPPGYWTILRM